MNDAKLIIGLGNPDPEYGLTYHNVGHLFVEALIAAHPKTERKVLTTDAYMNESGACVVQALKKYKLKPADLLVVQDDSDIPIGSYKISFGRNAGGHRGVQNVIDHLRTNGFWRLRVGIRPVAERKRQKAEDLVLKKISAADRKKIDAVFAEAITKL
ncbi:MAG: peptidyl-tRNA hydrolase [Candidatus Pacebacteria bacterium]|nr:peptidyl-tRNA hydrolase [Candidatus Paceibacterota bacterium]